MICNCKVDQDRFDTEAIAAFEEPVEDYQGGFVAMRYVEPAKACRCCSDKTQGMHIKDFVEFAEHVSNVGAALSTKIDG